LLLLVVKRKTWRSRRRRARVVSVVTPGDDLLVGKKEWILILEEADSRRGEGQIVLSFVRSRMRE